VSLIRHEARDVNEHGVQNCRRCGKVLCDLLYPGQTVFQVCDVFEHAAGGLYLMGPNYFTDQERRDAVLCPWRVH